MEKIRRQVCEFLVDLFYASFPLLLFIAVLVFVLLKLIVQDQIAGIGRSGVS